MTETTETTTDHTPGDRLRLADCPRRWGDWDDLPSSSAPCPDCGFGRVGHPTAAEVARTAPPVAASPGASGSTSGSPVILGRALASGGRVWLQDLADTGLWSAGDGVWLTRTEVESFGHGPVREVLLVSPATGRVLDAARELVGGLRLVEAIGKPLSGPGRALADAYDAMVGDRPAGGDEPTEADIQRLRDCTRRWGDWDDLPTSTTTCPDCHWGRAAHPTAASVGDRPADPAEAAIEPCADPACDCCYPAGLEEARPTGAEVLRYATFITGHPDAAQDARHRAATAAVIGGMLQDGWRRPAPVAADLTGQGRCGAPIPLVFEGTPAAYCRLPVGHASVWHKDDHGTEWTDKKPAEPASGSGPAFDRSAVEALLARSGADATDHELRQVVALLADRDRQESDAIRAVYERDAARRQRDAARVELAEAQAELERWRTGRRWHKLPEPAEVPDALEFARQLIGHVNDDEQPERGDLLRGAAHRLKVLHDAYGVVAAKLAEATAERDDWERRDHPAVDLVEVQGAALEWAADQAIEDGMPMAADNLRSRADEVREGRRVIRSASSGEGAGDGAA